MADYTLPDLPYDYAALEPHVSGQIMELHHDKHHAAYVTGANQTLEKLASARDGDDFGAIVGLEKTLAFHTSGHVLHSLFWQNLAPKAGGEPAGALGEQIKQDFGGFAAFKGQLTNAAMTIMGSGWAALAWEPVAKRLVTTQIYDHQTNITQGGVPILVLDAWEHAFYLQYGPDKKSFFEAVWNIWNWTDVAQRFEKIRGLDLGLRGATDGQ
jgi:superoxide dismutase, Fe-Mn family